MRRRLRPSRASVRDATLVAIAATLLLPSTPSLGAQGPATWELLPGAPLARSDGMADPKPAYLMTQVARSGAGFDRRRLWMATVGGEGALLRRTAGDGGSFAELGVRGGVSALFDLTRPTIEHMSTDFYAAVPITIGRGEWAVSVGPWHESSHLGDEYEARTSRKPRYVSHDQFLAIVSHTSDAFRVYAGGFGMSYHTTAAVSVPGERMVGGVELRGPRIALPMDAALRPLLALDDQRLRAYAWRGSTTAVLGLELSRDDGTTVGPAAAPTRLRVALSAHDGVSPYWQFADRSVRWFGVGVALLP